MSEQNQLAVQQPRALLAVTALTGLDQQYVIATVKAQCFKGNATDEQVDAFISIACEMKVNPLLPGMLYAYPISGGGIVPIMGPDGVYKKLTEHPEVDSWETKVYPEDVSVPPTHAITNISRKGREKPLSYTAILSEWQVGSNPNWKSRPRHMLGLRSLKQCARQIIHGIPYDEDDREIMGMRNVTPEPQAERPPPPPKTTGTRAAKESARKAAEIVVPPADQVPGDPAPAQSAPEPAKVVEQPKTETTAPKADPAPAKVVEAVKASEGGKTAVPRASLNDQEEATFTCTIVSATPLLLTRNKVPAPSVMLELKGEFLGKNISYYGGGEYMTDGDGNQLVDANKNPKIKPSALCSPGNTVRVTLEGRKLPDTVKDGVTTPGEIKVRAIKVESAGAGPEVQEE